MAKEMMIVFVYDTEACTAEDDDPAEAVLYFHPGWVSDSQRHALAGQVVGTAHCVKSLFSQPLSITLQSGKFILREYGRYILAVGSDRNIPDWVLKNRTDLLTSMIMVYHGDLGAVAAAFDSRQQFADKLYQMFETYLPVLQYGCHIFQRVPMLTLPRSSTSVYMEAVQVLDDCVKIKGVLGGVILYNNKIVASQLPPGLTSYLTVVDPYRIKSPADSVPTAAPLPLGAQLLAVYVEKVTYEALKKQAETMQAFADDGEEMLAKIRKNQESEVEKFPPTGMKRDKSLLFTAVPEEDQNMISPPTQNEQSSDEDRKKPNIPDVVPFTNRTRQRPNKLSLSFKTQKSLDEEAKENAEQVFTGQTSVCSTPMLEYKRLHGNMLSICQIPDAQPNEKSEPDVLKNIENSAKVKMMEHEKNDYKMLFDFNSIGNHYINKPEPIRKLASINDIQDTFKRLSYRATAKFKLKRSKEAESPKRMSKSVSTLTINDPSFPVFRNDGVEISESLFKQYMEQHQAEQEDMSKEDNMFTFNMKIREQEKFEGYDSDQQKSPQKTPKKLAKDLKTVDQSRRKSLSLPLKSLSDTEKTEDVGTMKKKLTGVQLTPLMEKLSHLAFSDKSSGYSSRVMTPLELREFTPMAERQTNFAERKPSKPLATDASYSDCVPLSALPTYSQTAVRCGLFVSGLQNMALLVVVDKDAEDCINPLWEISLNALGPIEQKCMEPFTADADASDYSYLVLDPDWGTVKKGGPWAALDIATMGLMHSEMFANDRKLSQIILRSATSVVYGCKCGGGGGSVYYGESAMSRGAGPPAPHDLLPAAAARAATRLARDHATHLF